MTHAVQMDFNFDEQALKSTSYETNSLCRHIVTC